MFMITQQILIRLQLGWMIPLQKDGLILNTNSINHPLIECLDHYTLIVEDAELTLDFYTNILKFKFIDKIFVNTGTVEHDEYDMINYVLELPGDQEQICVITQGLNDKTLFNQYLKKYGPGIHHVGYRCSDIQKIFNEFKQLKITIASNEIVEDPLFGLKQFFIDRSYSGVFIEFIERNKKIDHVQFTQKNMKLLVNTLNTAI